MKILISALVVVAALTACSSTGHGSSSQMYGQISGGVSHTF